MLGSIWFKHFVSTRKRKAPIMLFNINRGRLKYTQFDSASIFIGVQEEMKKYSLLLTPVSESIIYLK
ncbi:hypothetical protein BTA34_12090 [Proteus sp. CD3]|nr:hypothetical protein BTA34_12090 [Proteus sp. CD3]